MADMADTADIKANTANILARYRREADTSSAEAARNSSAVHREDIETGAAETGAAATGAAVTGAAATDSSLPVHLVTRTTGVGIHIGVGAIHTLTRTTAIILTGTILRTGTSMTIAPYQESDSLAPDPSVILLNSQSSRFTGVAALCFTTLDRPCACAFQSRCRLRRKRESRH
jgi:hypothetical protein